MENRNTIDVSKEEFERLLPFLTDVDQNSMDYSGHLDIKGLDSNIHIYIFYDREDEK